MRAKYFTSTFFAQKICEYLQIFEKVSSTLAKECRELFGKDSLLEINEKSAQK